MPLVDDIYLNTGSAVIAAGVNASSVVGAGLGFNEGAYFTGIGPVGRVYTYDIVPLTLNTAAYGALQTPSTGAIVLSAGTGVTSATVSGTAVYQADVPRIVTISSAGNDTGITFTVSGYDWYGATMTQTVTGVSAATVSTTKAFYQVKAVAHTGSVASTVTVGTGDAYGLPFFLKDRGYIVSVGWGGTAAQSAVSAVVGVTTSPATAFTGDVRGTYQVGSASNGTNRLVFTAAIGANQVGPAASTVSVLGVTQV